MVLKKQLKKNRKGFTLVEVIVVLVILAILAAIAIPALTGYIDKANEKAVISQTRSAVVAAQTIVSDAYGSGTPVTGGAVTAAKVVKYVGDATIVSVGGVIVSGNAIWQLGVYVSNGRYGYFKVSGSGIYSTEEPTGWSVNTATASAWQ
jgi:type IV pilus assembly protein PilA